MTPKRAVIVAEDDSDILEILSEILEKAGFTVYGAPDGKAAYETVLRQKDAVLLITDIVMPEVEGLELIRKTRQIRPDLKIIALSGGGIGDKGTYLDLAGRLGADDCIEKPFEFHTILASVLKVLG